MHRSEAARVLSEREDPRRDGLPDPGFCTARRFLASRTALSRHCRGAPGANVSFKMCSLGPGGGCRCGAIVCNRREGRARICSGVRGRCRWSGRLPGQTSTGDISAPLPSNVRGLDRRDDRSRCSALPSRHRQNSGAADCGSAPHFPERKAGHPRGFSGGRC